MAKYEVSLTKVQTYRTCRRAYWWRYVQRVKPRGKAYPLRFGIMVHNAIESIAAGKAWSHELDRFVKKQKLFAAERELQEKEMATARTIVSEYIAHWKNDPIKYDLISGKYSEHRIEVPLTPKINFVGIIDNVGVYRGVRLMVERKSSSDIADKGIKWYDLQCVLYLRHWPWKKFKVEGVLWDYLRRKEPTVPAIIKKGGFSTRDIDTLPSVVLAAAKEHGLENAALTRKLIDIATNNRSTWFRRFRTQVQPEGAEQLHNDFVESAREMLEMHGSTSVRTTGRHCEWCDFNKLCETELIGGSLDRLLERDYVRTGNRKRG